MVTVGFLTPTLGMGVLMTSDELNKSVFIWTQKPDSIPRIKGVSYGSKGGIVVDFGLGTQLTINIPAHIILEWGYVPNVGLQMNTDFQNVPKGWDCCGCGERFYTLFPDFFRFDDRYCGRCTNEIKTGVKNPSVCGRCKNEKKLTSISVGIGLVCQECGERE